MKNATLFKILVVCAVWLGMNACCTAGVIITDTFTRPDSTDLGTTQPPGTIYPWLATGVGQAAISNGTLALYGGGSASANVSGFTANLQASSLEISVDVHVPKAGGDREAFLEFMKAGTAAPFAVNEYLLGIHPTGVIYLKQYNCAFTDIARVENLTLSDTYDNIYLKSEIISPGEVKFTCKFNNNQIFSVTSTSNVLTSGSFALSEGGSWGNSIQYDNLTVTETSIPEPATVVVLGLAGVAFSITRKKR